MTRPNVGGLIVGTLLVGIFLGLVFAASVSGRPLSGDLWLIVGIAIGVALLGIVRGVRDVDAWMRAHLVLEDLDSYD